MSKLSSSLKQRGRNFHDRRDDDDDDDDDDEDITNAKLEYDNNESDSLSDGASNSSSKRSRGGGGGGGNVDNDDDDRKDQVLASWHSHGDYDDGDDLEVDNYEPTNSTFSRIQSSTTSSDIRMTLPIAERLKLQDEYLGKRKRKVHSTLQPSKTIKTVAATAMSKSRDEKPINTKEAEAKKGAEDFKKRSKHGPTEVSSKRSEFVQRSKHWLTSESGLGVDVGAHRYKPRDPRMMVSSGGTNVNNSTNAMMDHVRYHYGFVQDMRQQEIETLKSRIGARGMTGSKGKRMRRKLGITGSAGESTSTLEQDQEALRQLQQQHALWQQQELGRQAHKAVKQQLQQQVVTGERSARHFATRQEWRRRLTEAKFDQLHQRGGDSAIEKAVAKRRKRNQSRDSARIQW